MKPEISFESVREQICKDLLAMRAEDLDAFLTVLQPRMEANVRRRRRKEESLQRENEARKITIRRCRDALCLLGKQLKGKEVFQFLYSKVHEESDSPSDLDDKQIQDQIQKERMNRYLKRIGCPLRIL